MHDKKAASLCLLDYIKIKVMNKFWCSIDSLTYFNSYRLLVYKIIRQNFKFNIDWIFFNEVLELNDHKIC